MDATYRAPIKKIEKGLVMVAQNSHQKNNSSIAWFRLAEFVERKEKERALAMLKLLVHSVPDRAVATQLHADLLRAFDDERAFDAYSEAATFYTNAARKDQAYVIHEQIVLYALSLFKYDFAKAHILKTHLHTEYEQAHLCMRSILDLLCFFEQTAERDNFVTWACDTIAHTKIRNENFLKKLRALDEGRYVSLSAALLD
ncbi:MAG: hypothetical protein UU47_C0034G0003 [candidate division TM6 bacterium GW2011_GWE2_41_16]|nr:MAG: hypothetical protein UU47_C0034G0003 [candidate division TM6 bacterium GW2011_GWE2_41_16]